MRRESGEEEVRESKLERSAKEWAEDNGWLTMKYKSERGYPDRIFLKGGVTVWIEIKVLGTRPSAAQEYRIKQLRKAGALAYWSNCQEDIEDILTRNDPTRDNT